MVITSMQQRLVEVIADLGEEVTPRWRYGSGLIVNGRTVLTAAHTVANVASVTIRGPDKISLATDLSNSLIGDNEQHDLALIEVPRLPAPLPRTSIGLLRREGGVSNFVENCWSVGYP